MRYNFQNPDDLKVNLAKYKINQLSAEFLK